MPAGVDVAVEDGFATIEFVDPSLRGRGLAKLLEVGTPPELIDKVTRPRLAYIVPEGNAREAGLLDEAEAPNFAEGGPITVGDYSMPVAIESGYVVPGDGVPPQQQGVEARPGETVELVGTDTGGPYTTLPEVPDASYGPDSTPLDPPTPADEPTGDAQSSQVESAGDAELIEIPGGGTVEPATQAWPDGEPELEWKRPELDAYAASKGIDTRELPNKRDVLAAITRAAAQ
ncbi:hypothetical protein [Mycolicibacterium conceptionense]|uniref:hypothetical protein n=1 Tax=Mycolicibacterium conceptionense TaxID=451644 RepID=UPI001F3195BB|nr:hypothetical protein [Mycolicibacterium conceptionense]